MAVNTGLGSVEDAADEVEYATGSAIAAGARAGHTTAIPSPTASPGGGSATKCTATGSWATCRPAMPCVTTPSSTPCRRDPRHQGHCRRRPRQMERHDLPTCAATSIDLLSGHHYTARKFRMPFSPADAAAYEQNFVAYSGVAAGVSALWWAISASGLARPAPLGHVRLAIDEWGIVRDWNPVPDAPGIAGFEHYFLPGRRLAIARGLHEILRSADVVGMANWAQTVNVVGTIKTSQDARLSIRRATCWRFIAAISAAGSCRLSSRATPRWTRWPRRTPRPETPARRADQLLAQRNDLSFDKCSVALRGAAPSGCGQASAGNGVADRWARPRVLQRAGRARSRDNTAPCRPRLAGTADAAAPAFYYRSGSAAEGGCTLGSIRVCPANVPTTVRCWPLVADGSRCEDGFFGFHPPGRETRLPPPNEGRCP